MIFEGPVAKSDLLLNSEILVGLVSGVDVTSITVQAARMTNICPSPPPIITSIQQLLLKPSPSLSPCLIVLVA